MKNYLHFVMLLAACMIQAMCLSMWAQDVNIDLTAEAVTSGSQVSVVKNGVRFDYEKAVSPNSGAYIYGGLDIDNYKLRITATGGKKIAWVELVGCNSKNSTKTNLLEEQLAGGEFSHSPGSVSVWHGEATALRFACDRASVYTVQRVRVWFVGSEYVPGSADGGYGGGTDDEKLMGAGFVRTLSIPKNGVAVKMAIVTVREFADLAEEYALWKTQQGYDVTEVYADDYMSASLSEDANAHRIRERLKEIGPAFVLIMGDYEHVPAFNGTKYYDKGGYVTDYFYGEYSGDYFPEAYVGRFSCYDGRDIRTQMEKTKYMAQLPASEGDWLNTSLGLHNPASDIPTTEGYDYTMNYLRRWDATVRETSASSPETVNKYINEGCATLTYYGHSLVTSFNGSYQITDARKLHNDGKYPLMIGMTCLTGKFDNGHYRDVLCLGEQMQRLENAGSVAFIGATRESGAISNIHFMKGGTKNDQSYPGFMASMFPLTDDDPLNCHTRTLGEGVAMGSYSVNSYLQASAEESTEWWELFGDPTYQPYIKTPQTMSVSYEGDLTAGHLLKVKAVPNAVVCLSKGRHIWGVAATDGKGYAVIKIDKYAEAGNAVLYASAPGYTDYQMDIVIAANDGKDMPMPNVNPELIPILQGVDVIDHYTAQTAPRQWKDVVVTGESGARYATWVSSDDMVDCVLMQNNYDRCGIVTTKSGGCVRKVSIDWLKELGLSDCISVYGSNSPYSSPSDVWDSNKQGTLLGQIKKGESNTLVIIPNYAYVALRAENLDCKMKSITIGWGDEVFDIEKDHILASSFDFNDFTRNRVLIDKFTGQNCQYCASDDEILDKYIKENELHDKIYELRNYSFSPDQLCVPDLHYTFASPWDVDGYPNYMVDRCGYQGQKYVNNGYLTRAQAIKNLDRVADRFSRPCRVSLTLDGSTYNPATHELKVVVSGKADTELPDLRVNIFIAQNGIIARQSGGSSNYVHNGVSRAVLTESVFGDQFEMSSDGIFQITKTYTLPDKIGSINTVADNMDVVAFISSWNDYSYPSEDDDKDFENSEVHNTIATPITALPFYALPPALPSEQPEATETTYTDCEVYAAVVPAHYDKITYTRTFNNENWQALYVPFSIDHDEWSDRFDIAEINNFVEFDDNEDGIFDRTYLVVLKKTSGSTTANTPYLIRAKAAGTHTLVLANKTMEPAECNNVDCYSVKNHYTFTGTYTPITDMYAQGYYALSSGILNKANNASVVLNPQRWYLAITSRMGGGPAATQAQSIPILENGEDVSSIALSPLPDGASTETATWYDLSGRRAVYRSQTKEASTPGIIIVNRKKTFQ